MTSRTSAIIGWVLTALMGVFLIGVSGIPKFIDWPGKAEMMEKIGIPLSILPAIGVVEIVVSLLYLIPSHGVPRAILLTGYLGCRADSSSSRRSMVLSDHHWRRGLVLLALATTGDFSTRPGQATNRIRKCFVRKTSRPDGLMR
ncbi:MAG: DoxX family protein [Pirellulaceae bacterium]